ncbi:sphingomyelin synthase-related protein 1-like [Mytilus trossulus]|uniref:sphingomyelin synthase-related protein 1-like n=1 Tax=Mytilus trossulus TaxID=6551 RepID=UPI003004B6D2
MVDPVTWNCKQVGQWLKENGFEKYKKLLCDEHKINGEALLVLTENDLKQPPLQLTVLGDIKRLMLIIRKVQLQSNGNQSPQPNGSRTFQKTPTPLSRSYQQSSSSPNYERLDSSESLEDNDYVDLNEISQQLRQGHFSKNLDPELWKTALSFVYVFTVFLMTSFVMVIVHDRVPDTEKYPPLPDIFLDNVPYISWAFKACELIALGLGLTWIVLLFFHKHRFILMRRMFSMIGTIFILRCICMLITSLSVPGAHLKCEGKLYGDIWTKLRRTFEIWTGLGMTLSGVRTCGDYMFSGHTVFVTMLNFLITEYTPRKMYYLHTSAWVANMFALFFILAAHEHYSIDVFVAFYITSRMFLYYHTLANNRSLMLRDKKRTRIWFPLFTFFESRCDGIVPNEFEWPLPSWEQVKHMFIGLKSDIAASSKNKKKL